MVTVVKAGKPREVECTGWGNGGKGCGATLAYTAADVYYFAGVPGDSWGSSDPAQCIKCPECKTVTDLGVKDQVNTPGNRWSQAWYNNLPLSDNGPK